MIRRRFATAACRTPERGGACPVSGDFRGGEPNVAEEKEVLVVISKVKNYIRAKAGMNSAGSVAEALSDHVRRLCDDAIENARKDGRKTVMDRDFGSRG
jgi:hypothetical protein